MRRPAGGGLLLALLMSVLLVAAYVGVDRFRSDLQDEAPQQPLTLRGVARPSDPLQDHRVLRDCRTGDKKKKYTCLREEAAREGRDPDSVNYDDIKAGADSVSSDGPQADTPVKKKKRSRDSDLTSDSRSSDASLDSFEADSFSISQDGADSEDLSWLERHKRRQNKYKMQQETAEMKAQGLTRWQRHKKRNDPGYMSTKEMKELGMTKWERHKARQNGDTVGGAVKKGIQKVKDNHRKKKEKEKLKKLQEMVRNNQRLGEDGFQNVPPTFRNWDGSLNTGQQGWNPLKNRPRNPRPEKPMTAEEKRQKKIDDAIAKQRKKNFDKEYADGGGR